MAAMPGIRLGVKHGPGNRSGIQPVPISRHTVEDRELCLQLLQNFRCLGVSVLLKCTVPV